MNHIILTLRSSIKPALMRHILMRGSCISGIGVIILLLSGAYLSPDHLKIWGLPIFIAGIALITWGMLPYRRLRHLELHPYRITVDAEGSLQFSKDSKPIFTTPIEAIAQINYIEKKHLYGIEITLKDNRTQFFPYFSPHSFHELTGVWIVICDL